MNDWTKNMGTEQVDRMSLDENMTYCGRWHLVREIGRGAYGVVYLATGSDGTKRGEENNRRINALHDEGRDKAVTKQDAAERYNQAK